MRFLVTLLLAIWLLPVPNSLGQRRDAAIGATSVNTPPPYWGVTADLGAVRFDVDRLNTFFAPYTTAVLPGEGVLQTLQALISNKVFGYGSAYYQQALTLPALVQTTPSLTLHQHTLGFELHKVLVDKRLKLVLPSLGMGYRFVNVTYNPNPGGALPLDSLFQQAGAFTIRSQDLTLSAGAGLYYALRGFKAAGIRQLDLGLSGSYAYTLRPGEWSLFGTRSPVLLPPTRLNYYALRLSASLLMNR